MSALTILQACIYINFNKLKYAKNQVSVEQPLFKIFQKY